MELAQEGEDQGQLGGLNNENIRAPTTMAGVGSQLRGGGAAVMEKQGLDLGQVQMQSQAKTDDTGGGGNNGKNINNGGGGDGDDGDDDDYFDDDDEDDVRPQPSLLIVGSGSVNLGIWLIPELCALDTATTAACACLSPLCFSIYLESSSIIKDIRMELKSTTRVCTGEP